MKPRKFQSDGTERRNERQRRAEGRLRANFAQNLKLGTLYALYLVSEKTDEISKRPEKLRKEIFMNALTLFNDWLNKDFYGTAGLYAPAARTPDVDVTENKDSYILDMDLPGRSENDVSLELDEGVLTISSAKTEEKAIVENGGNEKNAEEKPQYLLRERRRAEFRRSFTLPKDIDAEGVTAGFKNGVLTVKIPRKPEASPKKIQISIA